MKQLRQRYNNLRFFIQEYISIINHCYSQNVSKRYFIRQCWRIDDPSYDILSSADIWDMKCWIWKTSFFSFSCHGFFSRQVCFGKWIVLRMLLSKVIVVY